MRTGETACTLHKKSLLPETQRSQVQHPRLHHYHHKPGLFSALVSILALFSFSCIPLIKITFFLIVKVKMMKDISRDCELRF